MSNTMQAVQTARLFEFYVKNIWPVHRLFAKKYISARCSRCAASEKMVHLQDSGLCDECVKSPVPQVDLDSPSSHMARVFHDLVSSYQGKGPGQYDALVLFSGGKDSVYMVKRISSECPGIRILTVSFDNGFMSPVAKENIGLVIEKLKVDHIFVRPTRDLYVKLFRYCLTHLNAGGSYETVDFSDGELMLDMARQLAFEKSIPLIICGYSKYQVENGLKLCHYESPREKELSARTETAGIPLKDIFNAEDLKYWWQGGQGCKNDVARFLFPLYAWNLTEQEIKEKVIEWGLISRQEQSPLVTNHRLIPLLGVVDVHRLGYSGFEFEFCRMIREGKAQVSQWRPVFEFLEFTSKTGFFVKPVILSLLAELNLELKDVGIEFTKETR